MTPNLVMQMQLALKISLKNKKLISWKEKKGANYPLLHKELNLNQFKPLLHLSIRIFINYLCDLSDNHFYKAIKLII